MAKSKYIVITSINRPSKAVLKFIQWSDWQVIVVGDRKTPPDWHCDGAIFLDIDSQVRRYGDLARLIPENTYTRKNLGYLYAIEHGAKVIFESDDDNIPYADAQQCVDRMSMDSSRSTGERRGSAGDWLNIYALFGDSKCWPRGFPIEQIKNASENERPGCGNKLSALIQFLVDEDPDVDAVYRMIDGRPSYFARDRQFILDIGSYCPVNSQATLWTSDAFPLLFLPLGVSDRVTDILRGYIATAALWAGGLAVAYASPIVYQKRNAHNLHEDFLQEMPLYANASRWCQELRKITETSPSEFYNKAIHLFHKEGVFSVDNRTAYKLFVDKIRHLT